MTYGLWFGLGRYCFELHARAQAKLSFILKLRLTLNPCTSGSLRVSVISSLESSAKIKLKFKKPSAHGPLTLAHGLWPMAYGLWPMAYGFWPVAYGLRLMDSDLRPVACVFMTCGFWLMGDVSWPVAYELWPSPPLS